MEINELEVRVCLFVDECTRSALEEALSIHSLYIEMFSLIPGSKNINKRVKLWT